MSDTLDRYSGLGRGIYRRGARTVHSEYEVPMRAAGAAAGAYTVSGYGPLVAVAGGFLGYQMPVYAYGTALWKVGHPILGCLMFAAPMLAGD